MSATRPAPTAQLARTESGQDHELSPAEVVLIAHLIVGLRDRFPEGLPLDTLGRIREYGDRMVDSCPDDWTIRDVPSYTVGGLARYWQVSAQAVRRRISSGGLFAIPAENGRWRIPELQLDSDGQADPTIVQFLREAADHLGTAERLASWLVTAQSPAPIDVIRQKNFTMAVTLLASQATGDADR